MNSLDDQFHEDMNRGSLSELGEEDALSVIGRLIDNSETLGRLDGVDHAIQLCGEVGERVGQGVNRPLFHYFHANAWSVRRRLIRRGNQIDWEWAQEEMEAELLELRRATAHKSFTELSPVRRSQILTNLGSLYSYAGRPIEAIPILEAAHDQEPLFGMPLANRAAVLKEYARYCYSKADQLCLLHQARGDTRAALDLKLEPEAAPKVRKSLEWYETTLGEASGEHQSNCSSERQIDAAQGEVASREWCLGHRLFLNPTNEVDGSGEAATDILHLPPLVTEVGAGPGLHGFYNQMKQEYVSARFLLYEGLNAESPHFSDKHVLLLNTLDYPLYGLAAEKARAAYRAAYSLLDKVSVFLDAYLGLGIKHRMHRSFRKLWFLDGKEKKGLRPEFAQRANLPMRGLFWLSKDLHEADGEFRAVLDPLARDLKTVRDCLEHRYLKIVDAFGEMEVSSDSCSGLTDRLAFTLGRSRFEDMGLSILKTARAALMYLSMAVHAEEALKERERSPGAIVAPMWLDVWEDDWKF